MNISRTLRGKQELAMKSRIMYVENTGQSLEGPARIGRVEFSQSGATIITGVGNFRQ